MQSADLSGGGTERFSADKGPMNLQGGPGKAPASSRFSVRSRLSPVTTAVALTAIFAATLFVLVDSVRTLQDARGQLASIGRSIVGDIAGLSPEMVTSSLAGAVKR